MVNTEEVEAPMPEASKCSMCDCDCNCDCNGGWEPYPFIFFSSATRLSAPPFFQVPLWCYGLFWWRLLPVRFSILDTNSGRGSCCGCCRLKPLVLLLLPLMVMVMPPPLWYISTTVIAITDSLSRVLMPAIRALDCPRSPRALSRMWSAWWDGYLTYSQRGVYSRSDESYWEGRLSSSAYH